MELTPAGNSRDLYGDIMAVLQRMNLATVYEWAFLACRQSCGRTNATSHMPTPADSPLMDAPAQPTFPVHPATDLRAQQPTCPTTTAWFYPGMYATRNWYDLTFGD